MFHLNIRSIDHFTELTSLLNNLDMEQKLLQSLKQFHINLNVPNYNMEYELRQIKRAGGVALYLRNALKCKVRNDLKIGNDPESTNSIFEELICKRAYVHFS